MGVLGGSFGFSRGVRINRFSGTVCEVATRFSRMVQGVGVPSVSRGGDGGFLGCVNYKSVVSKRWVLIRVGGHCLMMYRLVGGVLAL